jgi:AraC-like DNA-binding protein
MNSMTQSDSLREAANRQELIDRLSRAIPVDGVDEHTEGVKLARASRPTERTHAVSKPSLCVVAQGAKEVLLGESRYRYDGVNYLVTTLGVPLSGRIIEASPDRPYLSLRMDLDPTLVSSVMVESGITAQNDQRDARAVYVGTLPPELLDAVVRLARLLDRPHEAKVLMPLVKREIVFRLLGCEQGDRLRHLSMLSGHSHRIAQAVDRLRTHYDQPVSIEGLAREFGMSSSGFHHHFKMVMEMSPLQFQKLIRLQQARELMLGESLDASSAGYRVGYEDPSHFSRDYKRHFGNSPLRDVEKLRSMAVAD